jgi:hypothetical protein
MERSWSPCGLPPSNAVHGNIGHAAGYILHENVLSPVSRSEITSLFLGFHMVYGDLARL